MGGAGSMSFSMATNQYSAPKKSAGSHSSVPASTYTTPTGAPTAPKSREENVWGESNSIKPIQPGDNVFVTTPEEVERAKQEAEENRVGRLSLGAAGGIILILLCAVAACRPKNADDNESQHHGA